jgi:hypothetical protein
MTWNRLVKSDTEVVTSVTTSFVSAKFSGSGQRETPSEQSCQNSEVGKSLLTSSISDVRMACLQNQQTYPLDTRGIV